MNPLASRQRALDELRAVPVPAGMLALTDQRLLQLAAAASNDEAALSPQGQLYPVGMRADQALRQLAGTLGGQDFSVETLRARVASRFPRAEALPGRPELTRLLETCGLALSWDAGRQTYTPRTWQSSATATRMSTALGPLLGPDAAQEADDRLRAAIEERGYLAVLVALKRLDAARRLLVTRHRLTEVDVTAIMLARLRALSFPWEVIVAADSGSGADYQSLVTLFKHEVVPAVAEALAALEPVLITEAAPLARYGQLRLLQELTDATHPRPAARLLLLPSRRPEPALLDDVPVPLVSPARQSMWLPEAWLDRTDSRNTP